MSAPTPVEIVRPKRTVPDAIGSVVGTFAEWFVSAWALMLLVPEFASWQPSYGRVLALVVAIRVAQPANTSWMKWTRSHTTAKRGGK